MRVLELINKLKKFDLDSEVNFWINQDNKRILKEGKFIEIVSLYTDPDKTHFTIEVKENEQ